ncbi:MAG: AEC family transporter [Caldimonas sp.]
MQAIFAVTVPFFALVLLGWLAARGHVLPESAIPGLNAYVLFFALPCLLFRFGSSLPLERLADPALLGIYLASAIVVVFATVALTWRGRRGRDGVDLRDAAFGALVGAFPNAGFMGVPLLVALLGDAAAGPVIGAIVVDLVVTSTLCLALAQTQVGRSAGTTERSAAHGALLALRGALTNPLPWAIVIGACFSVARRELPGPIAQIVRMLGDSATPVALFTIGAVLWRAGQHTHTRTPVARYLPVALIKLIAHPALVFAIGLGARSLGAPVSPFGLMVLTLTAALPSASNVSLLAERYGADNGRVTRIIMASTVIAFLTFSACAGLFGIGKTS